MATHKKGGRGRAFVGDAVIPVSRLHLDLNNPRHEGVESEAEAIANLCDAELVAELAADIAKRGELSPLEVLGVVEMDGNPGHYVSLEGNRRTCALILLGDPKRSPPAYRSQIQRLADSTSPPSKVKAHVFARPEDAKQWIDLRHLGLQGGAGTKEWSPTQKQRAAGPNRKTTARANTLAVLVIDRLLKRGLITKQDREKVKITTLTRYLGTPGVRTIIGLDSPNELSYTHDADEVDAALQQLVLDSIRPLADGTYAVNSRADSKQRVAYANSLKRAGLAPTTHLPASAPPPVPTRTKSSISKTATRSAPSPSKRKTLFDSSLVVTHSDAVIRHLRHEAINLPVEEFCFSAAYLLRALVEQVMHLYLRARGKGQQANITDAKLTSACAAELRASGYTGRGLTAIDKAASNSATPYSLHTLGNAIHGGSVPAPSDLKRYADTWQPILLEMLRQMRGPKA